MPTKTKPKPKPKPKSERVRAPMTTGGWLTKEPEPTEVVPAEPKEAKDLDVLKRMLAEYESETGARANQVRLIDFIRWWEEREKQ